MICESKKEYDVERELALYKLRKIEIEDMRLKIEEIKVGGNLDAISYSEKVASTPKSCVNNDKDMELISRMEREIRIKELANQRVDNLLKSLDGEDLEIIKSVKIDKVSKSDACKNFSMSRQNLDKKIKKALNLIESCVRF